MYLKFYGLHRNPFHTTPDPEFLYLSPSHKQALGSIIYGIQERKGFIALMGEVGLGKTTILRSYLSQADNSQDQIIYLFNPNLSFMDLLQKILCELSQDPNGCDEPKLVSQLNQVLIEQYRKGKPVILIIDEAQNMPVATLESLRMLSNLETSKDKLIQLVLVGQPELDSLLHQHELRQLNQRIAVRATIAPLSRSESYAYIRHRLKKAGSKGRKIFTNRALSLISREAKGNPRVMNILCDNALVTGLGYKRNPVTSIIAKEVIADMNGRISRFSWKWVPLATGTSIFLVCIVWLMLFQGEGLWSAPYVTKLRDLIAQGAEMTKVQVNLQEEGNVGLDEIDLTEKHELLPQESIPNHKLPLETPSDMEKPLVVSTVQKGDTLEDLAKKVYGTATPKYIKQILDANPQITDSRTIFPGQKVTFPRITAPGGNIQSVHQPSLKELKEMDTNGQ